MDVSNSDNVHIEHILPQNPSDQALNEAGFGTHEEAKPYVSRLGNLTLLASGWNVKASNRPFSDKRALYIKSEIAMTRDLGTRDSWSAAAISDRSRKLASIAATVFREPAVIVAASRPR